MASNNECFRNRMQEEEYKFQDDLDRARSEFKKIIEGARAHMKESQSEFRELMECSRKDFGMTMGLPRTEMCRRGDGDQDSKR